MTTERVQIIVTQSGAIRVKKEIDEIGASGKRASKGLDLLQSAIGGISLVAIGRQLLDFADAGTQLVNKLNVAQSAVEGLNVSTDQLFSIARETRQPVNELATVFQRAALASKELGASQDDLLRFTEIVGKSLAVQGTSAAQARGALLQLSQAIGSSIVRAEEFNSQLEGNLPLLQAVARGIDAAGGSVSKLRQLVLDGEITNKQFFEGAIAGAELLEEQFASTLPTLSQGFTLLYDAILQASINSTTFRTIMGGIASVMIFVANNIDLILPVLTLLVAGFVQLASAAVLPTVIKLLQALNTTLLANPFILIITAITTLISLFIKYRKELGITDEQWLRLTETITKTTALIVDFIGKAIQFAIASFNEFYNAVQPIFESIKGFIQGTIDVVIALAEAINNVIEAITGSKGLNNAVKGSPIAAAGGKSLNDQLDGIVAMNKNSPPRAPNPRRGPLQGIGTGLGVTTIKGGQFAGAFRTGGGVTVGGVGGEDSQDVRLRLTPGERVRVETPQQVRRSDNGNTTETKIDNTIINVLDPNTVIAAMKTREGANVVKNIIKADASEFAAILGTAA